LQSFGGEDCKALAVTVGVGMNLVPILASQKKAGIWTLAKSDISRIMALLSDDGGAGRVLKWIQSVRNFSDESKTRGQNRFVPRFYCHTFYYRIIVLSHIVFVRYPKSREDVWALTELRLNDCYLTGEGKWFSYFRVRFRNVRNG
jgi:hypothetical protein